MYARPNFADHRFRGEVAAASLKREDGEGDEWSNEGFRGEVAAASLKRSICPGVHDATDGVSAAKSPRPH